MSSASSRDGAKASGGLPKRIGEYEVLLELASGGMAQVLLARHTGDAGFERLVALKRVHRHLLQDSEVFAMAADEARLAGLIRHPSVVPVIGVIDTGDELVLVQEYVEGVSAATLLKRTKLPPAIAARVVIDALRGLHAAHEAKDLRGEPLEIVHRDVSPQNLLVGSDGATRVIDFGIARAERRMTLTKTGVVKGKVQYMAPEQLEERPVDRRADVFAAGAVLYELVVGARPFGAGDEAATMRRVLLGDVDLDPVREVAPALAPIVERALEKRPQDRHATAAELAKALAEAVPPAEHDAVAAFVEEQLGAELARLRESVRGALGDDDASEEPAPESSSGPVRELAPPEEVPEAEAATTPSAHPTKARWLLFALAPVGAIAWWSLLSSQRDDTVGASTSSPPSANVSTARSAATPDPLASSATASASATPPDVASSSVSATASSSSTSRATALVSSGASSARPSATVGVSAAPSGRELLPSPYPKK